MICTNNIFIDSDRVCIESVHCEIHFISFEKILKWLLVIRVYQGAHVVDKSSPAAIHLASIAAFNVNLNTFIGVAYLKVTTNLEGAVER